MPRYTNKPQDITETSGVKPQDNTGTSGETTASQEITKMGLTDTSATGTQAGGTASGNQQQQVIPKTTVITGTTYPMPPRTVASTTANVSAASKDGTLDPTFANQATLRRYGGNPNLPSVYIGPQLVDENNNLAGLGYDSQGGDIGTEFFTATPAERASMISTIKRLGLFYGSKPSAAMLAGTGLDSSDKLAVQGLLDFSVRNGRTWRAINGLVATGQIAVSGATGLGKAYSVVSTEDAIKSVQEEFLRVLKRMPTAAEARQAALNIQSAERSRAQGGSMDPTSLGVAARAQAEKAAPGEFAANAAGSAINRIFSILGGR